MESTISKVLQRYGDAKISAAPEVAPCNSFLVHVLTTTTARAYKRADEWLKCTCANSREHAEFCSTTSELRFDFSIDALGFVAMRDFGQVEESA